ncbi:S-adenosyl-L-methionine-dependent methyltransferase [Corynascus novoguineensis]|uniref:S-adenosyl-L-methionine-dependent methyltransferase n=1 Tax=Corynascus novoguineensis TaxID=1126955 RepID=A0AAN7CWA0_9PEZI|nr:S-adenosyl-L-methionine-dependent methyltransferase [Corynascus novoguineensis]
MAAHLMSNYGTPALMNGHHSVTCSASADALEKPEVIQGVANTYLMNNTTNENELMRTFEPGPVPECMQIGIRVADNTRTQQANLHKDAVRLRKQPTAVSEVGMTCEAYEQRLGSTHVDTPSSEPRTPQATRTMASDMKDHHQGNGKEFNGILGPNTWESVGSATRTLKAASRSNGTSARTSYPSATPIPDQERLLDLTAEIAHNISQSPGDDSSRVKAVTAALELATALRPPGDIIMGWFANMSVISAVRLFMHWGAFSIIPPGKGESIPYAELAERINADEGLLVRVAAMLTSSHVLLHLPTSPTRPAPSLTHTPTSLLLRPGQPMSAMFSLMYNNVAAVSTILPSYFDAYGRTEPRGRGHIPTSCLAGCPEEDFFSLLKRDENALRDFGLAMRMTSKRVPVTGVYDMSRVLRAAAGRETVWVDIGGGDGHTVKEFLTVYPGLKPEQCVVQDLEEVVTAARKQSDEALKGVKWVGMNFFEESPVTGALVYYLRHILRDYSDPVSVTILRNIACAMTDQDSRVLISEQLNPDMANIAEPLPLYAAFKDFSMLSIGGKERSLEQFAALADAAGLRVSGVYRHVVTAHAVVELALK